MNELAEHLRFTYYVRVGYFEAEDTYPIWDDELTIHMYNKYGTTTIYHCIPLTLMPYIKPENYE